MWRVCFTSSGAFLMDNERDMPDDRTAYLYWPAGEEFVAADEAYLLCDQFNIRDYGRVGS